MAENPVFSPQKTKKIHLKIILIGILLFFILIGSAGFYFFYCQQRIKKDVINFLPAETSYYLRIKTNSKEKQVENFKEILNKFPNYQKISEKFEDLFEIIKNQNPFFKHFDFTFSEEVILAFFSPLQEKTEEVPFVLILFNSDQKKFEKIIKDFETQFEKEWEVKKENYKGRIIFSAKPKIYFNFWPKNFEINMTMIDRHFFIAFNTENIKKVIDVAEGKKLVNLFKKERKKSLSETFEYKKIKNYLPKEYLVLSYGQFDFAKILKTTKEKLPSYLFASLKEILNLPFLKEKTENQEKILFAGVIIAEKDGLKYEGYYFDLRKETILPSSFSFKNSLTNFLPKKIGEKEFIYYNEGRNLKNSFGQFEKIIKERVGGEKELEKFFEELEQKNGINPKEIFSLLEGNFAIFVATEFGKSGKPTVGLVFEIDKEEKIKENLLKIKLPKIPIEHNLFGLERAKDAKIISDLHQLSTIAEIIYYEEKSYAKISCNYYSKYGNIKAICDDIKSQVGSQPKIYASKDKYCAYSKLNESGAYYCIDSQFSLIKTYIDPGQAGYCTSKTFVCPKTLGKQTFEAIEMPEISSFVKEKVDDFEIYSLPLLDNMGLFFSIKEKKLIFTFDKESLIEILKSLKNEKEKLKDSEFFKKEFQNLPENLTQISFLYPFGFSELIKQGIIAAINLFANFSPYYQKLPPPENLTSLVSEFLEKGVFPYFKVLNSVSSFSFSPEKSLVISKGKIKIVELSESEKTQTEEFWENIEGWFKEKTQDYLIQ